MFSMSDQNNRAQDEDHLRLELPAAPEQVANARRAVAAFAARQSWQDNDTDALILALGEACSNAVQHSRPGAVNPTIVVSCRRLKSGCLQVDIRNQGNGFQPDLQALSLMPADEFATHGRGFGLMQALVDKVQVLSNGEDTTVRLTKFKTA